MEGDVVRERQVYGLWIILIALALGIASEISLFPVYSFSEGGFEMRILLAFITIYPVAFILGFLLPTVAILGLIGAYLVESSPRDVTGGRGGWWNRERVAIVSAVVAVAALLGSFVFLVERLSLTPIFAATPAAIVVAVGLYLFWTSERMTGGSGRGLREAALASGCFAAVFGIATIPGLGLPPMFDWWYAVAGIDIARWILGEVSLVLWFAVYAGIVLRGPRGSGFPGVRLGTGRDGVGG